MSLPTEGVWHVYTETSHHVLDLDAMTATRCPGQGDGTDTRYTDETPVATLRQDGKPLPLLRLRQLAVGERGIWDLQIRSDRTPTIRYTSIVQRLEREP